VIGGGLISTAIKHSHIDKAKDLAHRTQHALRLFIKEKPWTLPRAKETQSLQLSMSVMRD